MPKKKKLNPTKNPLHCSGLLSLSDPVRIAARSYGAPNSETRSPAAVGGPSFCFEAFGARARHGQKQKTRCTAAGFCLLVTLLGFKPKTS